MQYLHTILININAASTQHLREIERKFERGAHAQPAVREEESKADGTMCCNNRLNNEGADMLGEKKSGHVRCSCSAAATGLSRLGAEFLSIRHVVLIRLRLTQIENLRATVAILLQNRALLHTAEKRERQRPE